MPPEIAIILIVGIIYLIYLHIYAVVFAGLILAWIILICKARKDEKRQRENELRQRENELRQRRCAEENQRRMEENKREAERRAQAAREKEEKFQQAAREGKDVCRECKTIIPKRCRCGKCITYACPCWNNDSPYTDGECVDCYWRWKWEVYGTKKHAGYNVCDHCLSVEPDRCDEGHCMICVGRATSGDGRCYCGNCLRCYGHAGGNECNTCSSDG